MIFEKIQAKFFNLSDLAQQVDRWKLKGESIVFTNGCFDILHRGHVSYLAHSASLGTKLIIGLNTDVSVKRQGKGDDRPINDEESRAILLCALSFVDAVVLFDQETPIQLIQQLQPTILVKGADYDPNETDTSKKTYIVGREEVLIHGGKVKTIPLVDGFSTTSILQKIKK